MFLKVQNLKIENFRRKYFSSTMILVSSLSQSSKAKLCGGLHSAHLFLGGGGGVNSPSLSLSMTESRFLSSALMPVEKCFASVRGYSSLFLGHQRNSKCPAGLRHRSVYSKIKEGWQYESNGCPSEKNGGNYGKNS